MVITALATLMIMAAYFLILYGAVGSIQDKRFFSSAYVRLQQENAYSPLCALYPRLCRSLVGLHNSLTSAL